MYIQVIGNHEKSSKVLMKMKSIFSDSRLCEGLMKYGYESMNIVLNEEI
jgi:hypothetical protein